MIGELAYEVSFSIGYFHFIMNEDLGFRRILAKFKQKQRRLEIAQNMLDTVNSDFNLFNFAITVYGYNPEIK